MAKNITKAKHRFPLRQIRRIPKFLRRTWPVLTLVLITLFIIFLNYEPGTFLLGWDNLSSELAPATNLRRALFSVWQEYQSLGLLGGMAHAADLPRVFLIYLFSLIPGVPTFSLRYLFIFLPLVLGPLGTYYFLSHRLFKTLLDSRTTQYASFLGGLFYLLNLATLQTFFTPFESFTYFYGAFPWLLFFVTSYLEMPRLNSLLVIFILSFISAPAFYVETLFLVLGFSFIPFFSETFLSPKKKRTSLKKIFFSFLAILVPQLFWLLPVLFFVFTNGHVAEQAKINLISSPETYFRNLQFGNLLDLALLKGYFFNFLDLSSLGHFDYLLSVWRHHLAIPLISLLGYLFFSLILTGLYYSLTKKFFWTKSLIGLLAICLFFLLGGGLLLSSTFPFVGELFRAPFTKFSTPLSFVYACFFAVGSVFLLDLFTYLHRRLTYPFTLFSVSFSLLIFMSPIFSGNLISTNMRLTLPPEYSALFSYLNTQDPATRLANFPQYTFWGWNYYDWGYRGSGFLWYGLRQPILDRAFDVWEKNSENYYQEISAALYSHRQSEFEDLLDKYAISWILLDKHLIAPETQTDIGNATLEEFLTSSTKFSLAKNFSDQLYLYRVDLHSKPQNFLSLTPSSSTLAPTTSSPFSSLALRPSTDWIEKGEYLSVSVPLPTPTTNNLEPITLQIPSLTDTETLLPVRLEYQKFPHALTIRLTPIVPTLFAGDQQINLPAQPTIIQVPISTPTDSFILQLDHQFWPIQDPAEIPDLGNLISLGTSYLPAQDSFQVNLFDGASSDRFDLLNGLSLSDPVQCYSGPSISPAVRHIEKIVTPRNISLIGTDVVGCLSTPLPLVPSDSLISLSFTYSSATLTPGNANISGSDYHPPEIPQPLEPRSLPRPAQVFSRSTGQYQQANLILEASGAKSVQEITYQDVTASTHSLLFSTKSQIRSLPSQEIYLGDEVQNLQISLPITNTSLDLRQTSDSNGLFPESRNCDQFNPQGKTVKLLSPAGFLYQSQNAIECDYLSLRHLPHALNYLLSFKAEFQKGLPLTICFENHSTYRCDIYERLTETHLSQSLIQPIANSQEPPGYTLHLFNQSLGRRITSNLLKEISIRPIPLNFMNSISLSSVSRQGGTLSNKSTISNDKYKISSTHPTEFLYTVSLVKGRNPAIGGERDLNLSLYQTRSPYWQALELTQKDLELPAWALITKIFFTYPYLSQLPHNDTNLWHNSWLAPNVAVGEVGTISIAIIYLPQYLEFIGLAFLATPLFVFLFRKLLVIKKTSH